MAIFPCWYLYAVCSLYKIRKIKDSYIKEGVTELDDLRPVLKQRISQDSGPRMCILEKKKYFNWSLEGKEISLPRETEKCEASIIVLLFIT